MTARSTRSATCRTASVSREPPELRDQPGAVAGGQHEAAESRIRDANIAEESANLTRFNILTQSGIAALAQANQSSASVLALLR